MPAHTSFTASYWYFADVGLLPSHPLSSLLEQSVLEGLWCRDERFEAFVHPLISPLAKSGIADGGWFK